MQDLEKSDLAESNHERLFGDMFPETIFGEIPEIVIKFLVDSGFDRLVTLTTLTADDIVEIQDELSIKLKLGHKRLIIQMVAYAKNAVESKMATVKAEAKAEKIAKKSSHTIKSVTSCKEPNFDADRDKNLKEVLGLSLKKTIRKFCESNKIHVFDITNLEFVKSTDDVILYANATCICRNDVKIYTNSSSKNQKSITWVASAFHRHLTKSHTPGVDKLSKITEFLVTSKSRNEQNNVDEETEPEIGDNVIDITGVKQVEPTSSPQDELISGECTGNMKS